jgi:hypothetical protein
VYKLLMGHAQLARDTEGYERVGKARARDLATLIGTHLGTSVLRRMTDDKFKRYSRAIIYTVGAVYIGKAGLSMW